MAAPSMSLAAAGVLSKPELCTASFYEVAKQSNVSSADPSQTTAVRGVATGAGSLARLPALVDKLATDAKVLIVTGKTLAASPLCQRVRDALEPRCVGVFDKIREHSPVEDIEECLDLIEQLDVQILVGWGGGSPIDACKVLAFQHHERHPDRVWLRHISLPTTLSAAECSIIGGFTDRNQIKVAVESLDICPAYIIYDPELTFQTPEPLWLSTGIRAVDHAVENLYRPSASDYQKALSLAALRALFTHLPVSKADPSNVEARGALLVAAWQSIGLALFARPVGLSHALSKRIGATLSIPHGISSCITLAPSIKAMYESGNHPLTPADLEYINLAVSSLPSRFIESTHGQPGPLRLSAAVRMLIDELGLTTRVADIAALSDERYEFFTDAAITQLQAYGWTEAQLPTRTEILRTLREEM